MRTFLIIIAAVVVLVAAWLSFFTVGPTDYVYVTQFGRHVATYDGADAETDAGFHWRWPWPVQAVQRLDRRLQYFDLPTAELLTRDVKEEINPAIPGQKEENRVDKMLIVEAYACWKIADKKSVDVFIKRLGTVERAQDILGQRIISQLGAQFGQLSTKHLINTDATLVNSEINRIWSKLLADLRPSLLSEYGIDLVDVRLRRFYYSPQVRESIFAHIRSERNQKAEEYRSLGKKLEDKIRSDADKEASKILADASFYEKTKKGEADTKAAEIRNKAHNKDPEFYVFLKKLENLQNILSDNKTLLLLSTRRTFFEMLFEPPFPQAVGKQPPSIAGKKGNGEGNGKTKSPGANGPNGPANPGGN